MRIQDLIQEALKLSQAKPYVQAWNPNFHKEVFERETRKDKHAYRIYLPFETEPKKEVKIPDELLNYLQTAIPNKPYTTDSENYMQGLAYEIANPNRKLGIGKMLARSEGQEKDISRKTQLQALKKAFDADPQRAAIRKSNKLIVISRHPYDIAGMSTDRGWKSCMNLVDGINRQYVMKDVKQGSIIAYLINADDLNVNRPLARILIKPYQEKGNPANLAMMGDAVYGTAPPEFKQQVDTWINARYNADKSGLYCLAPGLYQDVIPRNIRLSSDADFAKLPRRDVVNMGMNDPVTWSRIVQLRSDADEILTQIAEKSDTRAAKLIKQIDVNRLTKAIRSRPQILAQLHTQPPELVTAALESDATNVRFVRNRTAAQHGQVMLMLKHDPDLITRVHEPTPEQIQYVVKRDFWLLDWALENHPHVLDETQIRDHVLRALKEHAEVDESTLVIIQDRFPNLLQDNQILKGLIKHMSYWVVQTMKLSPQLAQMMILHSDYEPEYYEDNWAKDHEPQVIQLLKQLPKSERDEKLISTVMRKYPELLPAFPDVEPRKLKQIVKKYPRTLWHWPDPPLDLVYTALTNDKDNDLDGMFQEHKYVPVWIRLIAQDPSHLDMFSDPPEPLLKAAAPHPDLNRWLANQILRAPRVTPAIQVRLLKRFPQLIQNMTRPSLAAQMAAITADPLTYDLIKPRDRHAAVKAYMRVYKREMRKPE